MFEVRFARLDDIEAIAAIYNEAIFNTTATFDIEPKTIEDRTAWFHQHSERLPLLVAEEDGEVLGWASLRPFSDRAAYRDTAETACYVHADHRGRGVGKQLKQALIEHARQQGFHTLIAKATCESRASMHINSGFGFKPVGVLKEVGVKFGRRLDVHIFQLFLD